MKQLVFVLAVLAIVALPAGCKSGLDPTLMETSVKPMADFVTDALAVQPDVELVTAIAAKAAAGFGVDERAAAEAAITKVQKFFAVPVQPEAPNLLTDLAEGAKQTMANISKAKGE